MRPHAFTATLACWATLAGCQAGPTPAGPKAEAGPRKIGSANVSAPDETPAPTSASVEPPTKHSSRPAQTEWDQAKELEVEPPGHTPKDCKVLLVRDWIRIDCAAERPLEWGGLREEEGHYRESIEISSTEYRWIEDWHIRPQEEFWRPVGTTSAFLQVAGTSNEGKLTVVRYTAIAPGMSPIAFGTIGAVPAIPAEASPVPVFGDWVEAVSVNTAPAFQRAKECEVRVLRDWVRVQCGALPGTRHQPLLGAAKGEG
ncbi:MAG: hypothetical protein HOW73_41030 [Polyangiaceae bacterium]|nr:hypothetical protein [Polyangiaceae bacterium]